MIARSPSPQPLLTQLLKFLLVNAAVGAAIGLFVAVALVVTDTAGMATLIFASSEPAIPLAMLAIGFATLFGGLYSGACIMALPWRSTDDDDDDPPLRPSPELRAATVRARGRRR